MQNGSKMAAKMDCNGIRSLEKGFQEGVRKSYETKCSELVRRTPGGNQGTKFFVFFFVLGGLGAGVAQKPSPTASGDQFLMLFKDLGEDVWKNSARILNIF